MATKIANVESVKVDIKSNVSSYISSYGGYTGIDDSLRPAFSLFFLKFAIEWLNTANADVPSTVNTSSKSKPALTIGQRANPAFPTKTMADMELTVTESFNYKNFFKKYVPIKKAEFLRLIVNSPPIRLDLYNRAYLLGNNFSNVSDDYLNAIQLKIFLPIQEGCAEDKFQLSHYVYPNDNPMISEYCVANLKELHRLVIQPLARYYKIKNNLKDSCIVLIEYALVSSSKVDRFPYLFREFLTRGMCAKLTIHGVLKTELIEDLKFGRIPTVQFGLCSYNGEDESIIITLPFSYWSYTVTGLIIDSTQTNPILEKFIEGDNLYGQQ